MPGRLERVSPFLPEVAVKFLRRHADALIKLFGLRPRRRRLFAPVDIELMRQLFYETGTQSGTAWDRFRDAHMPLPEWFERGLDPWSESYRLQQVRLWQLITAVDRDYVAELDEMAAPPGSLDAIRSPGFWARRDAAAIDAAGEHVLAMGMLLKHCRLVAGDHALEFGAGFGQSALALARLGVKVETVDISQGYCDWVREQGEFFRVHLRPHHAYFGTNPCPGERFKLIWFYESFHHCLDFINVVPRLVDMLDEGGQIILGGEPVFEEENDAVPYPWGVRLHSEVAAVMRQTRWMELGFTEPFLYELFSRNGLKGRRVDCMESPWARLYIFERR